MSYKEIVLSLWQKHSTRNCWFRNIENIDWKGAGPNNKWFVAGVALCEGKHNLYRILFSMPTMEIEWFVECTPDQIWDTADQLLRTTFEKHFPETKLIFL